MIGMISAAMVVTRSNRHGRSKSVQLGNREWATAIECVNADGWCIPAIPRCLRSVPPCKLVHGKRPSVGLGN